MNSPANHDDEFEQIGCLETRSTVLDLCFSMFTICFKPLITTAMIASLLVAQFAHVPHVHAGSSTDQQMEHSSRPHVHVDCKVKSEHGHSHAHGHTHNHKCTTKNKSRTQNGALAYSVDHDRDAVYLVLSELSLSTRSTFKLEKNQRFDVQPIGFSLEHLAYRSALACDSWHLPDRFRHCPIYLLTMSIRC